MSSVGAINGPKYGAEGEHNRTLTPEEINNLKAAFESEGPGAGGDSGGGGGGGGSA
jgi:hypothetical protein